MASNAPTPGTVTDFWTTGAAGTTCSSVGGAAASISYTLNTGQCYHASVIVNLDVSSAAETTGQYLKVYHLSSESGTPCHDPFISYYNNSTAVYGWSFELSPGSYKVELINAVAA